MSNILQNPTFGNWQHIRYFTDQEGKVGTIEAPAHWVFIAIPKEDDPNKLPQSLHRDEGFVISAGYRAWEAGYRQSNLQLKGGMRYQLKARIKADVNFPGGQQPDLTAITWRFTVESDKGKLEQDWSITSHQQTKQTEDFYFSFDVEENMTADITFWARSFYAGNDCDFWVYEITMQPVEEDSTPVPTIGTASIVTTTEQLATSDVEAALNSYKAQDKQLGDVMVSSEDIDLIAEALRALSVEASEPVAVGLQRLAEVLERLK